MGQPPELPTGEEKGAFVGGSGVLGEQTVESDYFFFNSEASLGFSLEDEAADLAGPTAGVAVAAEASTDRQCALRCPGGPCGSSVLD